MTAPPDASSEQGALRLHQKARSSSLTADEAAWLDAYESANPPPEEWLQQQFGNSRTSDLGVPLDGLQIIGMDGQDEYRFGNVNLAGGFAARINGLSSELGWPRGYVAELHGLASFCEAYGVPTPEGSEDPIGPFFERRWTGHDEVNAYRALAVRLLATLVHVASIALENPPPSPQVIAKQEQRFGERLEREYVSVREWLRDRFGDEHDPADDDTDHDVLHGDFEQPAPGNGPDVPF